MYTLKIESIGNVTNKYLTSEIPLENAYNDEIYYNRYSNIYARLYNITNCALLENRTILQIVPYYKS